jgi:hypothetical protein
MASLERDFRELQLLMAIKRHNDKVVGSKQAATRDW